MAGKFVNKPQKVADMYPVVNDEKLRMSMIGLADKWNEFARSIIYETYNDATLLNLYKNARDTKAFQHGWKDKSHREVVRFPNGYVYEFCKAVFEPLYGKEWALNRHVLQHELMLPWRLTKDLP